MESLYDLLLKPKAAFADIAESKTVSQASLIVLCATALATIATFAASAEGAFAWGIVILLIGLTFLKWSVSAAIWHLLAELFGGQGSAKCLLTTTGFVYFIEILIIPFYLLDNFFWPDSMGVTIAAGIVLSIWNIVLHIFAIRATYGISGARATLIFFLPLLIFFLFVLILVGMLHTAIMSVAGAILANPPQF